MELIDLSYEELFTTAPTKLAKRLGWSLRKTCEHMSRVSTMKRATPVALSEVQSWTLADTVKLGRLRVTKTQKLKRP
jgi:hypothetical protein